MALSAHALTTVEQAQYQIGDTSVPAAVVERLINAASDAIRRYCNRDFARQTVTERVAGYGSSRLVLSLTPVVEVASIQGPEGVICTGPFTIEDADAGFVTAAGSVWTRTGDVRTGPLGMYAGTDARAEIVVEYTGGYVTPAQVAAAAKADPDNPIEQTLPYDLEQACLELVAAWHHERQRDPGVVSEKLGNAGWTYGIPPWMEKLLSPWKRVV